MSTFPAIPNPVLGSGGSLFKAQVRTEFEGGYVQSRAKHTRSRKRFRLIWSHMKEADWDLLTAFFIANQGGSWGYTFLGTGDYRFSTDEIEWTWAGPGRRRVEIEVEEV